MRSSIYSRFPAFGLLLSILIQGGCGGGDGDGALAGGGIGGTGITSGTVTGFGSVFVNGIEFETSGSAFDIDDDAAATENDLAIGMVVTVTGSVSEDGLSGSAERIDYDDVVEGPVAAAPVEDADMVTKTFTVLGVAVIADRNTTVFANTDYGSLAMDDVVEVSGYFGAAGVLRATRIEKTGVLAAGTQVETRGTVTGFNGIDTFSLGALTVVFDGTTKFEDLPGSVVDGQYVEVRGTFTAPASILATRIEREDEGFADEVDHISLEGIVTDFNGIGDFRVSGQAVAASGATRFEPAGLANTLGEGDRVEVEGNIIGGILQASEIDQRGGDLEIDGMVTGKNLAAGTLSIEVVPGQPLTVNSDTQTLFDDERDGMENCTLASIVTNDELAIIGYLNTLGDLVASHVTCDNLEAYELRGPVDVPPTDGDSTSGSLSILGVTILTDDRTEFEDESEATLSGQEFFDRVSDGDLVEFEDEVPTDGIADEVEFEY
jgi:hypothetical protein